MATKLDAVDRRVERLATRVDSGHACLFGDDIPKLKDMVQTDVYQGGKVKERVVAAERELNEHKRLTIDAAKEARDATRSGRRLLIVTIVSILTTFVMAAGGVVYGYGRYSQRVEVVERAVEGLPSIRDDVSAIAKSVEESGPVKDVVERAVKTALQQDRATHYDGLCDDMSIREKRRIRIMLKAPLPPSCEE